MWCNLNVRWGMARLLELLVVATVVASLVGPNLQLRFDYSRMDIRVTLSQEEHGRDDSTTTGGVPRKVSALHVSHFVNNNKTKRRLPSHTLFTPNPWVNHKIIQYNLEFLPEDMEIHVFNHSSMIQSAKVLSDQLIQEANVTGAFEAFQMLRPWAYRADLWRYMILWSEGGVYMDGKVQLHAPVQKWAALEEHQTFSACYDGVHHWWHPTARGGAKTPGIFNGFFAAKAKSPILLEAIKMTIQNVQNRAYPGEAEGLNVRRWPWLGCLTITGPNLLGLAATSDHIPQDSYRTDCMFYSKDQGASQGDVKIASFDLQEHERVRKAGNASKSYWDLFQDRAVYCDDEGAKEDPDCDFTNDVW